MATIEWGKLRHAYGGAADIPHLLDQARRAPAGGSHEDEPWFSLWSALCHQGDVYTASYAAVPQLVAIADARRQDHSAARECLLLAGMIELGRAQPDEGRSPPPVPSELAAAYQSALEEGARLALLLRRHEPDGDYAGALDIAAAALGGNAAEARRLDRLDEEE